MAKWLITVPVTSAEGWQQFSVEAESEAAAISKFQTDGGEFVGEEVEVQSLGIEFAEAEAYEESPSPNTGNSQP